MPSGLVPDPWLVSAGIQACLSPWFNHGSNLRWVDGGPTLEVLLRRSIFYCPWEIGVFLPSPGALRWSVSGSLHLNYKVFTSLIFIYSDDSVVSERARRNVGFLLSMDRYCRAAIMKALTVTRYASSSDYVSLVKETEEFYMVVARRVKEERWFKPEVFRHCDAHGNLVHLPVRILIGYGAHSIPHHCSHLITAELGFMP